MFEEIRKKLYLKKCSFECIHLKKLYLRKKINFLNVGLNTFLVTLKGIKPKNLVHNCKGSNWLVIFGLNFIHIRTDVAHAQQIFGFGL
jgi:hypothetical protein